MTTEKFFENVMEENLENYAIFSSTEELEGLDPKPILLLYPAQGVTCYKLVSSNSLNAECESSVKNLSGREKKHREYLNGIKEGAPTLSLVYKCHQRREVFPIATYFGATESFDTWLLLAWDFEEQQVREFVLSEVSCQ